MSIKVDVFTDQVHVPTQSLVERYPHRISVAENEGASFMMLWLTPKAYTELRNQILAEEFSDGS